MRSKSPISVSEESPSRALLSSEARVGLGRVVGLLEEPVVVAWEIFARLALVLAPTVVLPAWARLWERTSWMEVWESDSRLLELMSSSVRSKEVQGRLDWEA